MEGRRGWRAWSGGVGLVLVVLLALAMPRATYAGGVGVTLDSMPEDVEAGVAFTVGFMIRSAHGDDTPQTGLRPSIIATNPDTGEQVRATAEAEGEPGHYAVTLTLPSAGAWQWQIQPYHDVRDYIVTLQGPLMVRAAGTAADPKEAPKAAVAATMLDSLFEPRDLIVEAGTTVTWRNAGKLPHTVTANDGLFSSGNIDAKGEFSYTFEEPGTYAYYCEYHAERPSAAGGSIVRISAPAGGGGHAMVGSVVVTAAAEPAGATYEQAAQAAAQSEEQPAAAAGQSAVLPTSGTPGAPLAIAIILALAVLTLGLAFRRRMSRAR